MSPPRTRRRPAATNGQAPGISFVDVGHDAPAPRAAQGRGADFQLWLAELDRVDFAGQSAAHAGIGDAPGAEYYQWLANDAATRGRRIRGHLAAVSA